MGRQTSGIFGDWKGRVGNLVGSSVYGTATIKTYREHINDKKSAAQIAQRSAFKACNSLGVLINSQLCIPLLKRWAKNMSAINKFVSLNTSAFTADGELITDALVISVGKMIKPAVTVQSPSAGSCDVAIAVTSDPFALPSDKLYWLVTDSTVDDKGNLKILKAGYAGVTRGQVEGISTGCEFDILAVGKVAVYAAFLRADGSLASDTGFAEKAF